jgi:hypothetical protein
MGSCSGRRNRGTTHSGVSERTLNKFNGTKICYSVDSNTNYHTIVKERINMGYINNSETDYSSFSGYCNDTGIYCGPSDPNTNYDFAFCYDGTECPINNIQIYN